MYGPAPLQEIIEMQLRVAETSLPYPLHFHTITQNAVLVDNEKIRIKCFETAHRIQCFGFSFEEKLSKRKILVDKVRRYEIPLTFYTSLQNGLDYITPKGEVIKNETLTAAPEKGKRYAFCADTRYDESLIEHIYGFDTIYHEATYLDNLQEKAYERFHSTTRQAAAIAKKAMIDRLLIGHFSSKYSVLDAFEQEARETFPGTELAIEGTTYDI